MQCQFIVGQSERSCEPSPHIVDIYPFTRGLQFEKTCLEKLITITLPMYFPVLDF